MCNGQTLQTAQRYTHSQRDKQIAMYYICTMELLHSNKKKRTTKMRNTDEPQNHCAEWQKPDTKEHRLCDSIYIKRWKMFCALTGKAVTQWYGFVKMHPISTIKMDVSLGGEG